MEEAFPLRNYFNDKKWASNPRNDFTEHARSYGVQKIFDLHMKKDYKEETLFIALGIFDRYINILNGNFAKEETTALATISVLMSAKLEQPISPSFTRMINLLNAEEKKKITKQGLIQLEACILSRFGFDFNFPGPMQSLERFFRLLGYQGNNDVFDMGFQICKFAYNEARFLDYRPSQVAASAALLAINIYEDDTNPNFNKKKGSMKLLNVELWNNEEVIGVTGYKISDFKDCLYELAEFISASLSPNRLKPFDIKAIKTIEDFDEIPTDLKLSLQRLR